MFGSRNFLFAKSAGGSNYATSTYGTLFTWGNNSDKQIGNGASPFGTTTFINYSSPIQITATTTWKTIGQGANALNIKDNGEMWVWGLNAQGSCGLGTSTTFISVPTQIGSLTTWKTPSSGSGGTTRFNGVIKTDGTLWMFGRNYSGQLGDGTIINKSSPIQVGSDTNWSSVSTCYAYYSPTFTQYYGSTLAVKTNGQLWAWGGNSRGQLGLGNTTMYSSPKQVGALTTWSKAYLGDRFAVAIKTDGTMWSWGFNNEGQLGLGNTTNYSSPKQIGSSTDWSKAAPGKNSCSAIKTGGTLWGWGRNSAGQLGDGTTTIRYSPVQIGSLTEWSKVLRSYQSAVALKTNFTAWSWGLNSFGQLGDGTTTSRSSPVQIGTDENWINVTAFAAGVSKGIKAAPLIAPTVVGTPTITGTAQAQSTLAVSGITTTGFDVALTFQWQANSTNIPGAIGQYYIISSAYVGQTIRCVVTATNVAGSASATTASTATVTVLKGYLWAWGQGGAGVLGLGSTTTFSSPVQVGSSNNWSVVTTNFRQSAAIADGKLYTTGRNNYGQLGNGNTSNVYTFTQIGALTNWYDVSMGGTFCAAIKTDGTLWAWGNGGTGQLGNGNTTSRSSPVQIGTDTNWAKVSCGERSWSAIRTTGSIWSCGENTVGQLGLGDTTNRSSPVQIGVLTNWIRVSAGGDFTGDSKSVAAVKADGSIQSWGSTGGVYSLGNYSNTVSGVRSSPIQSTTKKNWLTATRGMTCCISLKQDGTMWGWGGNGQGQLGDGTTTTRASATQIGSLTNWSNGAKQGCGGYAGGGFAQAIKSDGTMWTWGYNGYGALGDGTTTNRSSPVQVGALTTWLSATRMTSGRSCFGIKS